MFQVKLFATVCDAAFVSPPCFKLLLVHWWACDGFVLTYFLAGSKDLGTWTRWQKYLVTSTAWISSAAVSWFLGIQTNSTRLSTYYELSGHRIDIWLVPILGIDIIQQLTNTVRNAFGNNDISAEAKSCPEETRAFLTRVQRFQERLEFRFLDSSWFVDCGRVSGKHRDPIF